MKTETTFREILQNKFQLRFEKNKKYSMRSFAKDLGSPPALMSEVLSGKKGLSPRTAEAVAKKLGLSRVENLNHVQIKSLSPHSFSFSYLRNFHKQLLEKAILALEEQSVEERDITSLLVSTDSKRLLEARQRIREFRDQFIKEFNNNTEDKDSVYNLGIQRLNVTTKDEK